MKKTRLVIISDTHSQWAAIPNDFIPPGDVLIHCGDHTMGGHSKDMKKALNQLALFKDQFENIILIAGNHDRLAQHDPDRMRRYVESRGLIYLHHEALELNGIKYFGSPWQPWFLDWAFNLDRAELYEKWADIPDDTDVLITHAPSLGQGDKVLRGSQPNVGDEALWDRVLEVRPKLHVFGHIHEAYGVYRTEFNPDTVFVNASSCDFNYKVTQKPVVVDLTEDGKVTIVNEEEVKNIYD